jgi:hypothetical protein
VQGKRIAALGVVLLGVSWWNPVHAQVPERRLTRPDATFAQEFSFLRGVRELPDGRVMVADGLGQAVAILDLAAGTADTIGREGRGPREYMQPDGLFAMPGDSTLLVDLGNGRLTVLGPDFAFGRTAPIAQGEPRPGALSIRLPRGTDSSGRLYYQAAGRMRPDGSLRDSAAVLRWDPATDVEETAAQVKLEDIEMSRSGGPNNQSVQMRPKPMTPRDAWAVSWDGWIGVVRAADYHVEWVTPDGHVVRGSPVSYKPVKVGSAEKEAWAEESGRSGLMIGVENQNGQIRTTFRRGPGRRAAGNVDDLEWPDVMPPFQAGDVFATPWGELWAARSVRAGDPPTFDVFDRHAQHTKRIVLPEGRRIVGFGTESVYLARVDEYDLMWLERYRVDS